MTLDKGLVICRFGDGFLAPDSQAMDSVTRAGRNITWLLEFRGELFGKNPGNIRVLARVRCRNVGLLPLAAGRGRSENKNNK